MSRCPRGKRQHPTYQAALSHLMRMEDEGKAPPGLGSIYTCASCGEFHISSKRFTLVKTKGRGKSRRGIVFRWDAA